MSDHASSWLPSLITATPEEGYQLAIKLSRMAVKFTQPSDEIRVKLRPTYDQNANALVAVSQVVATNFATISQANNYWR